MAANIFPPKLKDAIVNSDGTQTRVLNRFFTGLPGKAVAVADVTVSGGATADEILLQDKINELLASLRTAGILLT